MRFRYNIRSNYRINLSFAWLLSLNISIIAMIMTIAFALLAALGLITSIRERGTEMNRVNYWFTTTSSLLHCIIVAYLAWFGIIGLTTWA